MIHENTNGNDRDDIINPSMGGWKVRQNDGYQEWIGRDEVGEGSGRVRLLNR